MICHPLQHETRAKACEPSSPIDARTRIRSTRTAQRGWRRLNSGTHPQRRRSTRARASYRDRALFREGRLPVTGRSGGHGQVGIAPAAPGVWPRVAVSAEKAGSTPCAYRPRGRRQRQRILERQRVDFADWRLQDQFAVAVVVRSADEPPPNRLRAIPGRIRSVT